MILDISLNPVRCTTSSSAGSVRWGSTPTEWSPSSARCIYFNWKQYEPTFNEWALISRSADMFVDTSHHSGVFRWKMAVFKWLWLLAHSFCSHPSQGCSQTCCSCEKKQRHINMKRPHRQDLCCRCKGMRLSCDATYSFKYIVWAAPPVCTGGTRNLHMGPLEVVSCQKPKGMFILQPASRWIFAGFIWSNFSKSSLGVLSRVQVFDWTFKKQKKHFL